MARILIGDVNHLFRRNLTSLEISSMLPRIHVILTESIGAHIKLTNYYFGVLSKPAGLRTVLPSVRVIPGVAEGRIDRKGEFISYTK